MYAFRRQLNLMGEVPFHTTEGETDICTRYKERARFQSITLTQKFYE